MPESTMPQSILREGKAEGEEQKASAIANNFLATGMSAEQVAKVTELSLTDVQQLEKQ
ncbi:MAG: hypothetical protein AAGG02_15955 [Cyanobacteria bacterium P01_H01_bin.15]